MIFIDPSGALWTGQDGNVVDEVIVVAVLKPIVSLLAELQPMPCVFGTA